MSNTLDKLIENLDARKKAPKPSKFPTPGVLATEIMLAEAQTTKADASTAKSHLNAIKGILKK